MLPNPYIQPSPDFFEPNRRLKIKKHFEVSSIKRIVIRGIDPLGDVSIGSAFYREVRRLFPEAFIVCLVNEHASQLLEHCPYLDEVRVFHKSNQWSMIRALRQEKFDLIFLLTGNLRAALLAFFAGIPHRVGFDTDGRGVLLTVRLTNELHNRYRGENHFDLLRAIGLSPQNVFKREYWVSSQNREDASQVLHKLKLNNSKQLMAFNPFARDDMRRWDSENWVDLLERVKQQDVRAVMFVGPNETSEGRKLLERWGVSNIQIVEENLLVTACLLENFNWVVGTDSGFIHLALAVDIPNVLAIYGLLPPNSSFPITNSAHKGLIKSSLACAPCYLYKGSDRCFNELKCMKHLTAQDVLEAMDEIRLLK